MDQGIIASFKKRFRSFQLAHALDMDAANEKAIYKVDILTAMYWYKAAWKQVSSDTIVNCWKHSGLVPPERISSSSLAGEQSELDAELDASLSDMIGRLNVRCPLTVTELITVTDDVSTPNAIDDDSILEIVIAGEEQEEPLDGNSNTEGARNTLRTSSSLG